MKPNDNGKEPIQNLDSSMRVEEPSNDRLKWLSPKESPFHLAGFPWFRQDGVYRRLPLAPRRPIPEAVDALANCTAGGQIRFVTNSPTLSIRVRLAAAAGMYHMAATGQCGFDCYIETGGRFSYRSTARFDRSQRSYESAMFAFDSRAERHIILNFPLYQGVEEVEIGVEPDADVAEPPSYGSERPVIVYGTSITQGGCATRPGMAYTNILSRRLSREFVNLGFSGNGRGEPEVAEVIGDIPNPACLVLDYEANCGSTESLAYTLPEFIRLYRIRHPDVPILVVSKIRYAHELFDPSSLERRLANKRVQSETVERFRQQGDGRVYFHDGSELLGARFDECSVDGSHPTDLGFSLIADGLAPVLARLLQDRDGQ